MTIIEETTQRKPEKRGARNPANAGGAPPGADAAHTIVELDTERVIVSTFNVPHREPDADLIASVREHGLIEPGIVRPIAPRIVTESTGAQREADHELVVGERRWKACRATGRAFAAIVRELTDAEVLDLQTEENLQRADLSPLQEAEVFRAHMVKLNREPAEIAARVHKSERFVVQRLKLLDLPEAARDALLADRIKLGTALEIACLREEDREAALELVTPRFREETYGVSEARDLITTRFHLRMLNARFDVEDGELVPAAGPCTTCPKRSKNQLALLIDGLDEDDRCLDRACWEKKTAEVWERRKAAAQAEGIKVLEGEKGRAIVDYPQKAGLLNLDEHCHILTDARHEELDAQIEEAEKANDTALAEKLETDRVAMIDRKPPTWREVLGAEVKPTAVGLQEHKWGDKRTDVVELVDERAALQHLWEKGAKLPVWAERKLGGPAPAEADEALAKVQDEMKLEKRAKELARAEVVKLCVGGAETSPPRPGPAFWRALLHAIIGDAFTSRLEGVVKGRGWTSKAGEIPSKTLLREAESLSETDLRGLVVEVLSHDDDKASEAFAKAFNVDVGKVRAAAKRRAKAELEGKGKGKGGKAGKAERAAAPAPATVVEPDPDARAKHAKAAKGFRAASHAKLSAKGRSAEVSP